MRKQRQQRAFASLTEDQINQIADRLRKGVTYHAILEWIAKPAPEGFNLKTSISPLQTLWARITQLDKINAHITSGQKLTLAEFDAINSTETPASEEVHAAILRSTHDLATSGDNTPTQLLALQRLADFPDRAAIRQERLELDRQKFTHKQEMDTFRKEVATRRLDLAERTFTLRRDQFEYRKSQDTGKKAEEKAAAEKQTQAQATPPRIPFSSLQGLEPHDIMRMVRPRPHPPKPPES